MTLEFALRHISARVNKEIGLDERDWSWLALQDASQTPSWETVPGSALVRRWALEVREGLRGASHADWALIGPAVVILHNDHEEAELVAKMAARAAGVGFLSLSAAQLSESAVGLRENLQRLAPALVFLKSSPMSMHDNLFDELLESPNSNDFFPEFERELQSFSAAKPVLFLLAANQLSDVPRRLQAVGLFDRAISITPPSADFLAREFIEALGEGVAAESVALHPRKLGAFLRERFLLREQRIHAALLLRRVAKRENRQAEFSDLVDLFLRGGCESEVELPLRDRAEVRRRVAYHEAGHAVISVIASQGKSVPEYASIVPATDFRGVVFDSVFYADAHPEMTYEQLQYEVRVSLAGRAAEELIYGPCGVGTGAVEDLRAATNMVTWVFSHAGFAPQMELAGMSFCNLAVSEDHEFQAAEESRMKQMVREFLASEYKAVLQILREHPAFLAAVADRLMWDPIVDQEEMTIIARAHSIDVSQHAGMKP